MVQTTLATALGLSSLSGTSTGIKFQFSLTRDVDVDAMNRNNVSESFFQNILISRFDMKYSGSQLDMTQPNLSTGFFSGAASASHLVTLSFQILTSLLKRNDLLRQQGDWNDGLKDQQDDAKVLL